LSGMLHRGKKSCCCSDQGGCSQSPCE
jgi:hypothetical protein